MALEQYTPKQKFILTLLVILGAAMFTVTGAMMASVQSCSGDQGRVQTSLAGELGGKNVDRGTFYNRANLLRTGVGLRNAPVVPVVPGGGLSEHLTRMQQPLGGYNQEMPLFMTWPTYHDEATWAFSALVQRALDAGFRLPPQAAAADFYFKDIGQEGTTVAEREKHFENYGISAETFLSAVSELMMVRDYVESLTKAEQVTYDEMLQRMSQRYIERKAIIYSVDATQYEAQARELLEWQESYAKLTEACASLAGAGGLVPNVSAIDELYAPRRDSEDRELEQKRLIAFDAVYADYEELAASYSPEPGEVDAFYMNTRGQNFRASQKDRDQLDQRFEKVKAEWEADTAGDVTKAPGDFDTWEAWSDAKREEMKSYLDLTEVKSEVRRLLRRFRGEQKARFAMADIERDLKTLRDERSKKLDAESQTKRAWSEVPRGRQDLLNGVQSNIDRLSDTTRNELAKLVYDVKGGESDSALRARLVRDLQRILTRRAHGSSAARYIENLRNAIDLEALEDDVNDRRMELEDERKRLENAVSADDKEERNHEVQRSGYRLEQAEQKLALARTLKPALDSACTELDSYLAGLELEIHALEKSEQGHQLLGTLSRNLLFEFPSRVRASLDSLINQDLKKQVEADVNARKAEYSSLSSEISRKKEDLSETDLFQFAKSVGLDYEVGVDADSPRTLDDLGRDSKWYWVANVSEMKSFLDRSSNHAGKVSGVIERPGYGLYIVRMLTNRDAVTYSPRESSKAPIARELAVKRLSRQLARQELERLRTAANLSDNPMLSLESLAARGAVSKVETDWFNWRGPVAELSTLKDPENSSSTAPSDSDPQAPFFASFGRASAGDVIGDVFAQGELNAERPAMTDYRYSVALLTARRTRNDRIPRSANELRNFEREILLERFARDEKLMALLNPKRLLADLDVKYYPANYEREESEDESQDSSEE